MEGDDGWFFGEVRSEGGHGGVEVRGVDVEVSACLVLVALQKHVHSFLLQDSVDLITSYSFLRPRFVGKFLDHRRKSRNGIGVDLDKRNHVNRLIHVSDNKRNIMMHDM